MVFPCELEKLFRYRIETVFDYHPFVCSGEG